MIDFDCCLVTEETEQLCSFVLNNTGDEDIERWGIDRSKREHRISVLEIVRCKES